MVEWEDWKMVELTHEQLHALDERPGLLRLFDPRTKTTYVLMPAEVYEKVKSVVDDDNVRDLEPFLAELAPEDWEDASNYR
jgi:hypothetical protein